MLATIATTALNGESMKLVKKETGQTIVEFKDHKAIFHSKFLEKVLSNEGILIPPVLRHEFDGKEIIFIDDPLFEQAFVQIYCRFNLDSSYEWKN